MMDQKKRVVVAMSGGVDSSVAAALLVEKGYDVTGLMLRLWSEPGDGAHNRCCTPQAAEEARRVAQLLDIPFHRLDAEQRFRNRVVDTFIREHGRGRTPNPCLSCNKHIKFGFLLRTARAAGAEYIATGHYARIDRANGSYRLLRGVDCRKDQSYFLFMLEQEQLGHALFPIGAYDKPQVRAMAAERGLPVAGKEESQDICFMRDYGVHRFLRTYAPDILRPGAIVDADGQTLGEHQGLPLYTIGQRRGIGVTWSEPLYVLKKDVLRNELIVGPASQLGRPRFHVEKPSFIAGHPPPLPATIGVKIRSTGRTAKGRLSRGPEATFRIDVERPLRDVTPGQAAVFYRGETVLGGGIITRDP